MRIKRVMFADYFRSDSSNRATQAAEETYVGSGRYAPNRRLPKRYNQVTEARIL
jgi:hypothetical protein